MVSNDEHIVDWLVKSPMGTIDGNEIRTGISNRQTIRVLLSIAVGALVIVAVVLVPRIIAENRRQAELWFSMDMTDSFELAAYHYYDVSQDDFDPVFATQVIRDYVAEYWETRSRVSPRIGNALKYIPVGAEPEPGSYTLLFMGYPYNPNPDNPSLPTSWSMAVIYFEFSRSPYFEDAWIDLNRDGFADPAREIQIETFQYETYDRDSVGASIRFQDPEQRWTVSWSPQDSFDEKLIMLLTSNGFDHPHDEPLPELPKNWWK